MTTKTIDCVDCGESVPYGRLSCPACGALLASVAGALRAPLRVVEAAESPDSEPEAAAEPELEAAPVAEPEPIAATAEPAPVAEPAPIAEPEPAPIAEPEPDPVADPIAAAVETPPYPVAAESSPWPPLETPDPVLEPRPYVSHGTIVREGVATSPAAYRPPTLALAGATAGAGWPTAVPAAFGGSGSVAAAETTARPRADDPTETGLAERSVEVAGWLVIAGAAMSILGFVLPWSRVVIGAGHTGDYFDSWGLASPTHAIVLAGLLVILGLGVVRTPVPAWISSGVLGLVAGGILVGLAWPYIVGPLGADVGVILALVGGVILGAGGVLASWSTRHVSEGPSV